MRNTWVCSVSYCCPLYRVCAANIRRAGAARDRRPGARPDPARRLEREAEQRLSENLLIQDLSVHALACLGETRDNDRPPSPSSAPRAVSEVLARHLAAHPRFREAQAGARLGTIVKAAPLHEIG